MIVPSTSPTPEAGDAISITTRSVHGFVDDGLQRLPEIVAGLVVFLIFIGLAHGSRWLVLRATRKGHRVNVGMVVGRLTYFGFLLLLFLGALIALTVVIPSIRPEQPDLHAVRLRHHRLPECPLAVRYRHRLRRRQRQGEVGPGAIYTPKDADIEANPATEKKLMAEIPLGRWGKPHEIGDLAVFLASDAASYITGSTYFIDGGMLRHAGAY